jgi:hypothetical protein
MSPQEEKLNALDEIPHTHSKVTRREYNKRVQQKLSELGVSVTLKIAATIAEELTPQKLLKAEWVDGVFVTEGLLMKRAKVNYRHALHVARKFTPPKSWSEAKRQSRLTEKRKVVTVFKTKVKSLPVSVD